MRRFTLLAAAATMALSAPAFAQTASPSSGGATNVTDQSTIRFVRRDADGNITFDSAASPAIAPGATDAGMAQDIAEADGATAGATDALGGGVEFTAPVTGVGAAGMEGQAPVPGQGAQGGRQAAMSDETRQEMVEQGAGGAADGFTEEMARQVVPDTQGLQGTMPSAGADAGGRTGGGGDMMGGAPFDFDAFAQEMYEQGYRQGYVRAMTEMRARGMRQMRRQLGEGDFQDRGRFRQQAQDTRQGMQQDVLRVDDGQGNQTMVILPQGVSPQQFVQMLRLMSQQSQ